jgi:hypothetical protein
VTTPVQMNWDFVGCQLEGRPHYADSARSGPQVGTGISVALLKARRVRRNPWQLALACGPGLASICVDPPIEVQPCLHHD